VYELKTMKKSKRILAVIASVVICLIAARLAISVTGNHRNYNFEEITTPEYKSDAARAIDAYERLMERYVELSESYLVDNQSAAQKLDSIDVKLGELSTRLARIEKALGIDPNGNIIPKATKTSGAK